MIIRLLTAQVEPGRQATLNDLLRRHLPTLRNQDGLRYVKLARQIRADGDRFLWFEEWSDPRALHRWAGPDLTVLRRVPEVDELLSDVTVELFEAVDIDPEDLP